MPLLNVQPSYTLIADYCNLWRNYLDIDDSWNKVTTIIEWFAKDEGNFTAVAGPGDFNDPDMVKYTFPIFSIILPIVVQINDFLFCKISLLSSFCFLLSFHYQIILCCFH